MWDIAKKTWPALESANQQCGCQLTSHGFWKNLDHAKQTCSREE